jgi:hypothetical protein
MASTERESASRVLQAWHELAGKEMRSKIETTLSTSQAGKKRVNRL